MELTSHYFFLSYNIYIFMSSRLFVQLKLGTSSGWYSQCFSPIAASALHRIRNMNVGMHTLHDSGRTTHRACAVVCIEHCWVLGSVPTTTPASRCCCCCDAIRNLLVSTRESQTTCHETLQAYIRGTPTTESSCSLSVKQTKRGVWTMTNTAAVLIYRVRVQYCNSQDAAKKSCDYS